MKEKSVAVVSYFKGAMTRRFPKMMQYYYVIKQGFQDQLQETKDFIRIANKGMNCERGLKGLTYKEVEIYAKAPKNLKKIIPAFLIVIVPFGQYLVIPMLVLFPRTMLNPHFWTPNQKETFSTIYHEIQLEAHEPVLRELETYADMARNLKLFEKWNKVLQAVNVSWIPDQQMIIDCAPLFDESSKNAPYALDHLTSSHRSQLLKMHGLHRGWRQYERLHDWANVIHATDYIIVMEGGVRNLTADQIRTVGLARGLDTKDMTKEEVFKWFEKWYAVSKMINKDNCSLLLHCPLLLSFNHRANDPVRNRLKKNE